MFQPYSPYAIPGIPRNTPLSPNRKADIIRSVICESYEVSYEVLSEKTRKRAVVDARHLYMYFMKNLTDASLKDIGEAFHQDHTTVIHGIKKVSDLIETDILFHAVANEIFTKINARFREFKMKLQNERAN